MCIGRIRAPDCENGGTQGFCRCQPCEAYNGHGTPKTGRLFDELMPLIEPGIPLEVSYPEVLTMLEFLENHENSRKILLTQGSRGWTITVAEVEENWT